ncbi:MAG: alpha/beta hydrolase [Spirochaetaceae bacterium]|jgi:pimeloyl-ACP methyl ester carboxylesterase|nr:alpha/beta hydrolase [Spirochaetaceae bacterium]
MLFKETGGEKSPVVFLLHGGGLSGWAWAGVVELLRMDYRVVTPVIDGHGEDGAGEFISIEDSADKLIKYIEKQYNGKVFALAGLSIGAQIVIEALTQREEIAEFAILESALILPIPAIRLLTAPVLKFCYGLIKLKWFSRLQAQALFVSKDMFEQYYSCSLKISKQSLTNIMLSNGSYTLKRNIEKSKAKVLIIAGEREIKRIKKSAEILNRRIPDSILYFSRKMRHGELSMVYPAEYVKIIKSLFNGW